MVIRSASGHADRRGRRRPLGAVIEMLEPRGMLSGTSIGVLPPPPTDGTVVVAPPVVGVAVAGLRLMLPGSVPNGVPTMAMISAVDAAGLPVFTSTGTVTLASSDASATLPSSVKLVNGRAMVPVTFRTAGAQTLTATDAADPTRVATASTIVSAPVTATRVLVLIPAQTRAGVPTTVTAVAVDAAGRPVPSFSGTATVASSDQAASLPLVEVPFRNGRATFQVSFATSGSQTVTVTSLADAKVTGTASTIVAPQPVLASFLVMAPPRAVAGTPVSVAIIAMDADKRPIAGYTGSVTLTSSDAGATLPATVTFVGGRAVARVTFATAGAQTITARGGVAGDVVGTASTTVVAAPVVTRFAVVMPKAVPAGVPVLATIVAVDAQGRPVMNFSGTATLASSDTAARLPSTVTFVNGRAVARLVFTTLGEQTLTATSGSLVGSGKTQVGQVTIQPVA